MKQLFLILILFASIPVFAQTEVDSTFRQIQYHPGEPEIGRDYQFVLPYFPSNRSEPLFELMHDSILSILTEYWIPAGEDENPYYPPDPESTQNNSPDYLRMNFKVLVNTKRYLTFHLFGHFEAGGGGRAISSWVSPFNMDLEKQELITLDNLFDPKEKEKVLGLAKGAFVEEMGMIDDEGWDKYVHLMGFQILENGLEIYYRESRMGMQILHSHKLKSETLQPLLRQEYADLFEYIRPSKKAD